MKIYLRKQNFVKTVSVTDFGYVTVLLCVLLSVCIVITLPRYERVTANHKRLRRWSTSPGLIKGRILRGDAELELLQLINVVWSKQLYCIFVRDLVFFNISWANVEMPIVKKFSTTSLLSEYRIPLKTALLLYCC